MNPITEEKKDSLAQLCSKYAVKRLEIFGSGTGKDFDPAQSDLDFLVCFESCAPVEHAERYLGLLAALQDLFDRKIDLVELGAIKNPYFVEDIQSTRKVIYAA